MNPFVSFNIFFAVAAFVFLCYSSYITLHRSQNIILASSTNNFELSVFNDDYPQPETIKFYPWDFVAEPLKQTTIEIINSITPNGYIYWKFNRLNKLHNAEIFNKDYGEFDSSIEITEYGLSYLILTFKDAGIIYQMDVTEYEDSTKQNLVRVGSYQISSKFVRREIRELTEDDRTKFFDGLEMMHRLTDEAGKSLYGEHFKTSRHFTLKHIDRFNQIRCTLYHGGDVLLTSHASFSLSYERSLQSMFPDLALPFWDFSMDNNLYGTNWVSSPIFSDDWFSPIVSSTEKENYPIASGRFAYTPVLINPDSPERNSYGRISTYFNNNPSIYTTRSDVMCDIPVSETSLPGCEMLQNLLTKTNLTSFRTFLQDEYHTRLHGQLGGYWGCRNNWGTWIDSHSETWEPLMRHLAQRFFSGFVTDTLNLTCPTSCNDGDDCSCSCPDVTFEMNKIDDLSLKQKKAFDVLDAWGTLDGIFLGSPTKEYVSTPCASETSECTERNYFKDLPTDEQLEFWPWLLAQVCTPPKFSDIGSPLAAPFDPIFIPLHHNFIRWWSYFRILAYNNPDYDETWNNDNLCYGHHYLDTIGFGITDIGYFSTNVDPILDSEHLYTNQALDLIFHPFNSDLPYIFGSFDYSYCDF